VRKGPAILVGPKRHSTERPTYNESLKQHPMGEIKGGQAAILADQQYLIRFALRKLLEQMDWQGSILEASHEQELLDGVKEYESPLVFIDYLQPGGFGIETIGKITRQNPNAQIMVISADQNRNSIYQSIELGAHSYLTKNCREQEIFDAIRALQKQERFYCAKVLDLLLEKSFPSQDTFPKESKLSAREMEIVHLTAKGLFAKEIAQTLNISMHTVYTHRKKILQKLNVKNASQLVSVATNRGWIIRS
jgi:DNA-binding NarL/FixJ family response regulator